MNINWEFNDDFEDDFDEFERLYQEYLRKTNQILQEATVTQVYQPIYSMSIGYFELNVN